MRFLPTSVAVWILLSLAAVAPAQPPSELTPTLLRQFTQQGNQGPMRFKIDDGRVILDCRMAGNYQRRGGILAGTKEALNIVADGSGRPKLNYTCTTAAEEITIDVAGSGDDMTIRRMPRGKATFDAVEFRQIADKDVALTLGTGDRRQVFRAADLWRLLIVHPKECGKHLVPLLNLLRPDWKVPAMTADVETRLLAIAGEADNAARTRWATLVKQLGDERFAQREAANRALRAGGPSALGYLRQLDFNRLDAEQQFRVHRILDALGGKNEDDSADEAAASLARDPSVWLALLARPEAAKRQIAARQLAALLDGPINVDPAAEPDTQKNKRDALRAKIERK